MAEKDLLSNRLKNLNKNKEAFKQEKPNVMKEIAEPKDEKPDFMKMAESLESKKEERTSENDFYQKDTIYIRKDLFSAMNALCEKQGDKKKFVNQAYEEFLTRIYKEKKDLIDK